MWAAAAVKSLENTRRLQAEEKQAINAVNEIFGLLSASLSHCLLKMEDFEFEIIFTS